MNILAGTIPVHLPVALDDPEVNEELRKMYEIDLANRYPKADVRSLTYPLARTSINRSRLEQSDDLVERLSGHSQIRKKRRFGIPRFLESEGIVCGLPLFAAPLPQRPQNIADSLVELHYGARVDELEWDISWIVRTQYGFRSAAVIIDSFEVRGLLWLPANTFYEAHRRGKLPGRLEDGRYDADVLMRYVFRGVDTLKRKLGPPSRLCPMCGRYK
jgi:hypothetical protein